MKRLFNKNDEYTDEGAAIRQRIDTFLDKEAKRVARKGISLRDFGYVAFGSINLICSMTILRRNANRLMNKSAKARIKAQKAKRTF